MAPVLDPTGIVLISWQHEAIRTVANAILGKSGIAPSKWPGDRFDLVWVFDLQPGEIFIQSGSADVCWLAICLF
jgi:hypothetical protein